jgi:hypothetical protein
MKGLGFPGMRAAQLWEARPAGLDKRVGGSGDGRKVGLKV